LRHPFSANAVVGAGGSGRRTVPGTGISCAAGERLHAAAETPAEAKLAISFRKPAAA
jgi:hypothetical protein